ncbi:MAG: hypothetical protein JHC93_00885 [Parachlamydiales bacterium]|nr:hypothetical protein [Parachlamydiales bacterium]
MNAFQPLRYRWAVFFIVVTALFIPTFVKAQSGNSYGVAVRLTSPETQRVPAGGTAYFSITVHNQQSEGENFVGRITTDDYSAIPLPDELNFYLGISAAQEQQIALYVPSDTAVGTYTYAYFVEGRDNSVLRDQVSFSVEVIPGRSL